MNFVQTVIVVSTLYLFKYEVTSGEQTYGRQEYITVGCVPSAAVAVSAPGWVGEGVWSGGPRRCLLWGVSAPRGYLVGGVWLGDGCIPACTGADPL